MHLFQVLPGFLLVIHRLSPFTVKTVSKNKEIDLALSSSLVPPEESLHQMLQGKNHSLSYLH